MEYSLERVMAGAAGRTAKSLIHIEILPKTGYGSIQIRRKRAYCATACASGLGLDPAPADGLRDREREPEAQWRRRLRARFSPLPRSRSSCASDRPAVNVDREAIAEDRFEDLRIPPGTLVLVIIGWIHHNLRSGTSPAASRASGGRRDTSARTSRFGGGARICAELAPARLEGLRTAAPGTATALLQLRVVAHLRATDVVRPQLSNEMRVSSRGERSTPRSR